jgi:hypothetical protein
MIEKYDNYQSALLMIKIETGKSTNLIHKMVCDLTETTRLDINSALIKVRNDLILEQTKEQSND